jgi:hypothetical protein
MRLLGLLRHVGILYAIVAIAIMGDWWRNMKYATVMLLLLVANAQAAAKFE